MLAVFLKRCGEILFGGSAAGEAVSMIPPGESSEIRLNSVGLRISVC